MARATDKMPLEDYVRDIAEQLLGAVTRVEEAYPEWEIGGLDIGVRCVLKPVASGTRMRVFADIDEPQQAAVSEIPLRLRRRLG